MSAARRGLLLLLAQVLIAGAVYGFLAAERLTYPRVWARTVPVDPLDPFRGRYVRLWLEAEDRREAGGDSTVAFGVENGRLVARSAGDGRGERVRRPEGEMGLVVTERPVAFFIPEHVPDPSLRERGEDLWVEVTVLPSGLPRPLRIAHRSRAEGPP